MSYCGFVLRDCIRMPPARDIFPIKTSVAVGSTLHVILRSGATKNLGFCHKATKNRDSHLHCVRRTLAPHLSLTGRCQGGASAGECRYAHIVPMLSRESDIILICIQTPSRELTLLSKVNPLGIVSIADPGKCDYNRACC